MLHQPREGPALVSAALPEFPWDTLAKAKARAAAHPGGIVDLSVGTPVDPVAPLIRDALAAASSEPGYPATAGTARLRESAVAALARRFGVTGLSEAAVLPVIGPGADRLAADPARPGRGGCGRGAGTGISDLRRRVPAWPGRKLFARTR